MLDKLKLARDQVKTLIGHNILGGEYESFDLLINVPIKTPAAPINRGEGRRPQGRYSTVGFRLVAELK